MKQTRTKIKEGFIYLEDPEEIKKQHFNRLLKRLDKPLFTMEELYKKR